MSPEMKAKVLITDDEADMIIFLSTLLDTHGFEPVIAKNGKQGLQRARDEHPVCIVLNAMMSDEEGIDMYIGLRYDKQLKKIPVIMLSTIASRIFFQYWKFQNTLLGQKISEPEAYMESPLDAEELIRQVKRLISGK